MGREGHRGPGGQRMWFHQQLHLQGDRLAKRSGGWLLPMDSWMWDALNHRVTLLWHSRCFRDQDLLSWSLGCKNLMGLQKWRPLPNFWHSLWRHESGGDRWGLQKRQDSLSWSLGCQNWMGLRFQRPGPNFGHSLRQMAATRSLDPTEDLMDWIHMGLDKLLLDSTEGPNRLVAKEQHTALSLSLVGKMHA